MLEMLVDPAVWASFLTLCVLEIVLGFDNLILISILSEKLPPHKRAYARRLGLIIALVTRILLLSMVFILSHLTEPLFSAFGKDISIRDIVLIVGGLFLIAKGTHEIHGKIEGDTVLPANGGTGHAHTVYSSFAVIVSQIVIMDIVFSFDSVLTAVGVAEHVQVMIAAIIVSVIFMLLAVNWVSEFISKHPTVKVLALSYMLLIGMALIAEGLHFEIPKGYLYFAMAFSFSVEGINIVIRKKHGHRLAKQQDNQSSSQ